MACYGIFWSGQLRGYFCKLPHYSPGVWGWWLQNVAKLRACLHGVGDPDLVGLVSFVFTLWGTQNKRNLPH